MSNVLAEEADRAGGGRKVAGDAVEQRGLAGTVGAEHGAAFAGTYGDGDVGERGQRAEQPCDAAQLQGCAGTDGGEALGDAIHGRVLHLGDPAVDDGSGASAATGRSRRPTTRIR